MLISNQLISFANKIENCLWWHNPPLKKIIKLIACVRSLVKEVWQQKKTMQYAEYQLIGSDVENYLWRWQNI